MCGGSSNNSPAPAAAAAPTLPKDVQSVLDTLYLDPNKAVNPATAGAKTPQVATDQHNAQVSGPMGYTADMKKNLGMDKPMMGYGSAPAPAPSGMTNHMSGPAENQDFMNLFSK